MAIEGELTTERSGGVQQARPGEVRIRRALLSVSDKRGLVELARGLRELDVEIVSTGGTARQLSGGGPEGRPDEGFPGFPADKDRRGKTPPPRLSARPLAPPPDPRHPESASAA